MGDSNAAPLLLLDNSTFAYILGNGEYRLTNLKFEEAKAILDMSGDEVVKCFINADLENLICDYLNIEKKEFPYQETRRMQVGQDAIAFKLYITPSGTQPIIIGDNGVEAKKIKNLYIHCQHIVRLK